MTHHLDAAVLIDTFAETDPRMPLIVFSLLSIYMDEGPFEFDAAALADRLSTINLKARVNPEIPKRHCRAISNASLKQRRKAGCQDVILAMGDTTGSSARSSSAICPVNALANFPDAT